MVWYRANSCFLWVGLAWCFLLSGSVQAQKLAGPVQGYVSVEPYEIRLEFVIRYSEAAHWLGLGEPVGALDPAQRTSLEERTAAWLAGKCPVSVDDDPEPLTFKLQRSHFVRTDPEKGLVVEDRDEVLLQEARLGVVFATNRTRPPKKVSVHWEVFPQAGTPAIIEIGSEDERITREATPGSATIEWTPSKPILEPALLAMPPVPRPSEVRVPWLAVGICGCGIAGAFFFRRHPKGFLPVGIAFGAGVVALGVYALGIGETGWSPPWARVEAPTPAVADEITFGLLRNVYHAFDFRSEESIYDTLRASASESLVGRVFLEVTRSLQVEGQGGARVRVLNLDLRKCEVTRFQDRPAAEFDAECEWIAIGNVTHWGHTHKRLNRYRATLTISGAEGQWKLTGIELHDESRL